MKFMGIDYGEKRIGIATSDQNAKIAFPKKVIFNRGNSQMIAQLRDFVKSEHVARVIVGLPISLNGGESAQTVAVREFADTLKHEVGNIVEFENEMLSTHLVQGVGVPREHTDEAAAAVILQSYLDKKNR